MDFLTLKQASTWATELTGRNISISNISYLIQYGRVRKHNSNGNLYVTQSDLEKYYKSRIGKLEIEWKKKLGDDLNWALSFDNYSEKERTKHVHRLHPYKGKFIPQLVEYFLDNHTDDFKRVAYFKPGDVILDPFCGSGTTLVQANELGMHAIGIDISAFNALISNSKLYRYNLHKLYMVVKTISRQLNEFISEKQILEFEGELLDSIREYNNINFPSPEFKYNVNNGSIDEHRYGREKANGFLTTYWDLIKKYEIELDQNKKEDFLDRWYLKPVREEIDFVFDIIKNIKDIKTKIIVSIILSRAIRSCRATTHSDLATLKEPINSTYYCTKHKKICKPLFSIKKWWDKYSEDAIDRLVKFEKLRTDSRQVCLIGDSKSIDLIKNLKAKDETLGELVDKNKVKGIFTSPPYVGLIDYHEQHAYAYSLFGFERRDEQEIGPLSRGTSKEAREAYAEGIAQVLLNIKSYLADDYNAFIVANDKYNLYPEISKRAGMRIVNRFKRPVLNRTEKDKGAYSETIFHLKGV